MRRQTAAGLSSTAAVSAAARFTRILRNRHDPYGRDIPLKPPWGTIAA
ncbi:MAG: hypothetical protein WCC69_04460 [Pirellulales bacterium]